VATRKLSYDIEVKPRKTTFDLTVISCDYKDCTFAWTDGYLAYDAGVEVPDNLYTEPEDQPTEILVYENPDLCVHSEYKRVYCPEHGEEVWEAICAAFGADPNAEGKINDNDDY